MATCRQSPYLHKPGIVTHSDIIVIMTSFVILIMMSRVYCARSPRSHYDVILIVTSFTTELATPTVTDVRTLHTDTLPRLIYRDVVSIPWGLLMC